VPIHCAGILSTGDLFQAIDPLEIDVMVAVSLLAPLKLTRLILPGMVERGRGHLLFVGSSAGRWPHPNAAVHGAQRQGSVCFATRYAATCSAPVFA
jgi:short-subunit dehydrogenase